MELNAQKSTSSAPRERTTLPRPPKFDTMRAVKNLKEANLQERQAVAIIETIQDTQAELATGADLKVTRTELRAEMGAMKAEMGAMKTELKAEMGAMKAELKADIDRLGLTLRGEMQAQHSEIQAQFATMYWRFLLGVGVIVGIAGTVAALVGGK